MADKSLNVLIDSVDGATIPVNVGLGKTVNTGALLGGVSKSIVHNLGNSNYQIEVDNGENNVGVQTLKKDPADPANKIIIKVLIDFPGGLNVSIIGFD